MDPVAILAARQNDPTAHHGRPHLWSLIVLMLILLGAAITFLSQPPVAVESSPTPTESVRSESRVYVVSYRFGVFSPTNLRIHAGDTVRWRNDSPLAIRIVAQLQEGDKVPQFDSVGQVQPGSYFSYTFPVTGTFTYFHATNKTELGVIIVR